MTLRRIIIKRRLQSFLSGGYMKKILVFIAIFLCTVMTVFAGGKQENASGQIRVMLANHPYGDLLKSKIPEFEAQTGIKVNLEQLQESQLSTQLTTEFATNSSTVDVFMTRPLNDGLLFMKNKWYAPLDFYDFSDYPANTVDIGRENGTPYIVPLATEWQVLYYRKDLLQAAGIAVPKTFKELEEAAAKLTKNGIAGIASRGKGAAAVTQMSSYLYNYGGYYLKDNKAVFDSDEALEAIRFYGKLLGTYGPQGITSMSWENIIPVFQAGKVALWTDASVFYGQVIDSAKTKIPPENIGIANFPAGPKKNTPFIVSSWGMSVSSQSKNLQIAKLFLDWATSKEMAKEGMKANITMARNSAWSDKEIQKLMSSELVATQAFAAKNGYPYDRPFMASVGQARDLIGEIIIESITTKGTSPKLPTLAKEKAQEVDGLLKADGEYGIKR